MALSKKIEERYEGFKEGEKKEIDELILDDIEVKTLSNEDKLYLQEFTNLIILSANNCSITSLKNLPKLENLEKLELTENKIQPTDLSCILEYKQLRKLLLGNNKDIKTLDDIKPLTALKELYWLDLSGCGIISIKDYRNEVFKLFPQLEVLDGSDKSGKEIMSDEDEDEIQEEEDDSSENSDDAPKKRAQEDSDYNEDSDDDSDEKPSKGGKQKASKKKKFESDGSDEDYS